MSCSEYNYNVITMFVQNFSYKWSNYSNRYRKISAMPSVVQGWGLLSWFLPFCCFPNFPQLSKHTLAVEYHFYIWQVSPQLSCGETCQIWMWFKESNRYFFKIKKKANGALVTSTPDNNATYYQQELISWSFSITMTSHKCHVVSNHQSINCLFNSLCRPILKKYQHSCNLPFMTGIYWLPVNFPVKSPLTQKKLPFGDMVMSLNLLEVP